MPVLTGNVCKRMQRHAGCVAGISEQKNEMERFRIGKYVRELMEIGFLRESAADSPDDNISGVVTCTDTLLQRLLLNQLRQESCRKQQTYTVNV